MANAGGTQVHAPRSAGEDPPRLAVTFSEPRPGVLVARVTGELDLASAPELDTELRAEIHRRRPRSLVLELAGLEFLGLHGTAVFEGLQRRADAHGMSLCLAGLPHVGERVLAFVGVLDRFDRRPDLRAALAASC